MHSISLIDDKSQYVCLKKPFQYLILGDHSVEVKLSGSHVEGSPFLVKAYNADKVKVTDINNGVVGKPVFFSSQYKYQLVCQIVCLKSFK